MPAPKSAKSTAWFCRVVGEEEYLRPKVVLFAQALDVVSMLATHHKGDSKENPHIHFVVQMATEVQKQSFALRVKKAFEIVDKNYALDPWDGRKAEYGAGSYLFHEDKAPILVSKLWTAAELQEAQRIAKITNEAVAVAKQKASTKFVDRAIEKFKDKTGIMKYDIFSFMMEEVSGHRLYWPGTFKAKSMVEEVEIKLTTDLKRLTNEYYSNIFR